MAPVGRSAYFLPSVLFEEKETLNLLRHDADKKTWRCIVTLLVVVATGCEKDEKKLGRLQSEQFEACKLAERPAHSGRNVFPPLWSRSRLLT